MEQNGTKNNMLEALLKKGKATGKLTTHEIDDVIVDAHFLQFLLNGIGQQYRPLIV
jgi:hypothetical protein